jgi:endonuclease VIII-like 1
MPEGPELNLSAQFVNQTCRGRVFSGQVLKSDVSRQPLVDWNEDAYMISAVSRGKELILTLHSIPVDEKQSKEKASKSLDIVFQFGMSGKFDFYEATVLQKHAHLNFFTQNNNANQVQMVLSFVDYRRFGKWQPGGSWSPERGPCVLTEYLPFRWVHCIRITCIRITYASVYPKTHSLYSNSWALDTTTITIPYSQW